MERALELRIKGQLREIQEANNRAIGSEQGYPPAEKGYTKTLESVAEVADRECLDAVANYIKNYIEEHEERPSNKSVRKETRSVVSAAGYPIDDYLNRA